MIDQGKCKKLVSKWKCNKREYHVKENEDFAHKYVKIFCDMTQFPSLKFCGPHTKPHILWGLSRHDHMRSDPKLLHGTRAIRHIPCDCATCTYMLDKPWTPGLPPHQHPRFQPVKDSNCNSIKFSHETFEEIHQDFIDGISDNMDVLFQSGKYCTTNTTYSTKMGYYVIHFFSEAYIIQKDTEFYGKIVLLMNWFSKLNI